MSRTLNDEDPPLNDQGRWIETTKRLEPDAEIIERHLRQLHAPFFGEDRRLQIGHVCKARKWYFADFEVSDDGIEAATTFAVQKSEFFENVYIRPASFQNATGERGALQDHDVLAAPCFWIDCDGDGDCDRAESVFEALGLRAFMRVVTGYRPHLRGHYYVALNTPMDNLRDWREIQSALIDVTKTDRNVVNCSRMMRLAGSVAWPRKEGRVPEFVELYETSDAPKYSAEDLRERLDISDSAKHARGARPGKNFDSVSKDFSGGRHGRSDDDLIQVLADTKLDGEWHTNMRSATATMVGRGFEDLAIHGLAMAHGRVDDPPKDGDIQRLIDDARKKGWSKETQALSTGQVMHPARFTPCPELIASKRPPVAWLYDRFRRKHLAVTVAAPGTGKSTLAIVEALAMSSGEPILQEPITQPLRVALINLEDDLDDIYDHVCAATLHYNLSTDDYRDRLWLDDGSSFPVRIARRDRDRVLVDESLVKQLIDAVDASNIDILIVDPFVASHAVDENDNTGIDDVLWAWRRIAKAANIAVHLVHHTRKTNGRTVSIDDVRGASSIIGAARWVRLMRPITSAEAEGLPSSEIRDKVCVIDAKLNRGRPQSPRWFQKFGVRLGNGVSGGNVDLGDEVGCIKYTEPPVSAADVDRAEAAQGAAKEREEAALANVRKAVSSADLRYDSRARGWWGHAIADALGIPESDRNWKSRAERYGERWLRDGHFKRCDERDAHRKMREFVRLPDYEASLELAEDDRDELRQ